VQALPVQGGGKQNFGAGGPQDPNQEQPIDPRVYLAVLRKRLWWVLGVFALVVGLTAVWLMRQPRIYRASTSIVINPRAPQILNQVSDVVDIGSTSYWSMQFFYGTQNKVLGSRQILSQVAERLGLGSDEDFLGIAKIEDPARRAELKARIDPVDILQGAVSVSPEKDTWVVWINVEDRDPARAARISVAVAEVYQDANLQKRTTGSEDALSWLSEQIGQLKPRLEKSEEALFAFRKSNDMLTTTLADRQSILARELSDFSEAFTRARTLRIELEAKAARISEIRKEGGSLEALPEVSQNDAIRQLKGTLFKAKQERAALAERYGEKHPNLIEASKSIASIETQLKAEVEKLIGTTENQYQTALGVERGLRREIDKKKAEAFNLNEKEIGYSRLVREKQDIERLYDMVTTRAKETGLTGQQTTNNVQIVDRAELPKFSVKPRVSFSLAVAGFFGLLLGVGLAFLLEFFDNTVKSQEDVEGELGQPFLGIIPLISEREASASRAANPTEPGEEGDARGQVELHILQNPRGHVAEACRSIRTNLLFMSPEKPLRRVVVTSAGPREGKTTTVVDLGVVMAQSGSTVCLVDTDMRRPRLHKVFGVNPEQGLSNLIVGKGELHQVLLDTPVEGLSLLPCGPIPPNPAELLHTKRFKAVVEELLSRFDLVIFDSPPLTAVADAKVLSVGADGVVVIAKSHFTTRELLGSAINGLLDVKARILGVVLNQVDIEKRGYGGYYYQYYQSYGAYYGSDSDSSKDGGGKKGSRKRRAENKKKEL